MEKPKSILHATFDQRELLTTEWLLGYEYEFDIVDVTYYVDQNGNSAIDVFEIKNLYQFDSDLDDSVEVEITEEIESELRELWLEKFEDEIFDDYIKRREDEEEDYHYLYLKEQGL